MVTLINSPFSFVRFNESDAEPHCIFGDVNFALPVYDSEDIYFQFVIHGTEEEINSLCTDDVSELEVSLVSECDGLPLVTFTEKPVRIRLSETQMLYWWNNGFPLFENYVNVNECFKVQLILSEGAYSEQYVFCSNKFERIGDDCFTSVIEYSNDEDAFGFKYCYGGDLEGAETVESCEPTIIQYFDRETLTIPYTAGLRAKYGNFPTIQSWVLQGGELVNVGHQIAFDQYPPTQINIDFGGLATGIIVIR